MEPGEERDYSLKLHATIAPALNNSLPAARKIYESVPLVKSR